MEQVRPFEPGPDIRAALTELERRFMALQAPVVTPDGVLVSSQGCDPRAAGLYAAGAVSLYDQMTTYGVSDGM